MGLNNSVIRLIIQDHARHAWQGPVLTLGVQDIVSNYQGLTKIFQEERVPFRALSAAEQIPTTAHYFRAAQRDAMKYAHPRDFFRMLGLDGYDDLDFADFEKPTLIHDMNHPIPADWRGKYGLVLDGGTIEHIFDVRTVVANVIDLIRVGGDVLHVSPLASWINHGFYSFSPCFFYDLYQSNGFDIRSAHLFYSPKDPKRHKEFVRPFEYTESYMEVEDDDHYVLFVFRATKRTEMPFQIPFQGIYRRFAASGGKVA